MASPRRYRCWSWPFPTSRRTHAAAIPSNRPEHPSGRPPGSAGQRCPSTSAVGAGRGAVVLAVCRPAGAPRRRTPRQPSTSPTRLVNAAGRPAHLPAHRRLLLPDRDGAAVRRIVLRRATTLQGLATAAETTIWSRSTSGEMGAHISAPEIHFMNNRWYVYFAAGRTDDIWRIRMTCWRTRNASPLTRSWTERGRIHDTLGHLQLDASTFVADELRWHLTSAPTGNVRSKTSPSVISPEGTPTVGVIPPCTEMTTAPSLSDVMTRCTNGDPDLTRDRIFNESSRCDCLT